MRLLSAALPRLRALRRAQSAVATPAASSASGPSPSPPPQRHASPPPTSRRPASTDASASAPTSAFSPSRLSSSPLYTTTAATASPTAARSQPPLRSRSQSQSAGMPPGTPYGLYADLDLEQHRHPHHHRQERPRRGHQRDDPGAHLSMQTATPTSSMSPTTIRAATTPTSSANTLRHEYYGDDYDDYDGDDHATTPLSVLWPAGTWDDPVPITSAQPERVVACTGPFSAHAAKPHPPVWLTLRRGRCSQCPDCGQVFVLQRRHEHNALDARHDGPADAAPPGRAGRDDGEAPGGEGGATPVESSAVMT